jgi:hypothetical protein
MEKPLFLKTIDKTIENFDFNIPNRVNITGEIKYNSIFYKWYDLFKELMKNYLDLPTNERLYFKSLAFITTTFVPLATSGVFYLIGKNPEKTVLKPLWYFEFKNIGNFYIAFDILKNTFSLILTLYTLDSGLQTITQSLVAFKAVANNYGFKDTSMSLYINKEKLIPIIIDESKNALFTQLEKDRPTLYDNYLILFGIGLFLYVVYQNKK